MATPPLPQFLGASAAAPSTPGAAERVPQPDGAVRRFLVPSTLLARARLARRVRCSYAREITGRQTPRDWQTIDWAERGYTLLTACPHALPNELLRCFAFTIPTPQVISRRMVSVFAN